MIAGSNMIYDFSPAGDNAAGGGCSLVNIRVYLG